MPDPQVLEKESMTQHVTLSVSMIDLYKHLLRKLHTSKLAEWSSRETCIDQKRKLWP